ncbi:hypothetical protein [Pantoea cypripedii]|uniref:Uncharacterized protein n=1 Tax=Pantoea cypripedii TaxID=55209 RepID=A0A6B9G7X1_PANCY|nr:hypothetical protein [Pantoea cypripedii]QGY28435.1 hypothetical protein CUN67_05595 [Pantoea cypripedii]
MRKSFKIALVIALVITATFAWFWPVMQMSLAGSAHYTEQDKREYEFYTPDILKKMPRISGRYEFAFYNVAGPESQGHTVTFHDTTDTSQISAYLTSLGYVKHDHCSVSGACWRGSDPQERVSFSNFPQLNEVLVTVAYSPNF